MNSKDLCMLEHLPELIEAGVSSAKIEGRMKSVFYVATVVAHIARQSMHTMLIRSILKWIRRGTRI